MPIALEESEIKNLNEAINNTNFKNIWKVLKALRSHDSRLVDEATFKEKIKIFGSDDNSEENHNDEEPKKDKTEQSDPKQAQKSISTRILTIKASRFLTHSPAPGVLSLVCFLKKTRSLAMKP